MKRLDNQNQVASHWYSSPIQYVAMSFLLLSIFVFAGCSSLIFGPQDPNDVEVAVAATVEVAVEQTVTARLGTVSVVEEMAGQDEQDSGESSEQSGAVGAADALADADAGTDGSGVPELSAEETELAEWITANTRHYIGDPNAPVVFIEFSDFQ